ncbi:hypothetical protein QUF70_10615, partial [Desulfobacterales bacterium HSG17]|nr:hypothetical protein [Desulfobacterales bacterium HSG17]
NNQGGINGRNLELIYYNDDNELEKAENIALEIADTNNALLVIISILISVFIYRLQKQGNEKKLNTFLRTGKIIYPCFILIICVFLAS